MLDEEEFRRWLRQAEHTLESAERDRSGRDYAWACFKAEQAAQCALKALLIGVGQVAHGHSLRRLIQQVEAVGLPVPPDVAVAAEGLVVTPSGSDLWYHGGQDRKGGRSDGPKTL